MFGKPQISIVEDRSWAYHHRSPHCLCSYVRNNERGEFRVVRSWSPFVRHPKSVKRSFLASSADSHHVSPGLFVVSQYSSLSYILYVRWKINYCTFFEQRATGEAPLLGHAGKFVEVSAVAGFHGDKRQINITVYKPSCCQLS